MKPILFNTEMVQAILEGRKTVTRRAIKLDLGLADTDKNDNSYLMIPDNQGDYRNATEFCRYQVGDILYVRETFCPNYFDEFVSNNLKCAYRADWNPKLINGDIPEPKWKPSIHMPKELARIFLRVADVRVERLQDITEEEAISEGIKRHSIVDIFYKSQGSVYGVNCKDTAIQAFVDLWNSTIKKADLGRYGWEANPWVWAIEFERMN